MLVIVASNPRLKMPPPKHRSIPPLPRTLRPVLFDAPRRFCSSPPPTYPQFLVSTRAEIFPPMRGHAFPQFKDGPWPFALIVTPCGDEVLLDRASGPLYRRTPGQRAVAVPVGGCVEAISIRYLHSATEWMWGNVKLRKLMVQLREDFIAGRAIPVVPISEE